MLNRKENNIANWNSWIIAIIVLFFFYILFVDFKPIYTLLCVLASVFSILILLPMLDNVKLNSLKKILLIISFVWVWCVLLAFLQGADKPLKLRELEYLIIGGLLSFLLCNTKIKTFPLTIVYYLIVAFFYSQYFIIGVDSHGVLGLRSGAINTIVLLSLSVIIQLYDYHYYQKISLLPSVVILPIAVMSWNRTGLLSSAIYMLSVFFVGSSNVSKKNTRTALYVLLIFFILFMVVRYYDWFQETSIYSKIEEQGANSGRSSIWSDYFSTFGIIQFLFGRAIDEHHLLLGTFANPHNSFIMLHAQTGVLAVFFICVVIKRLWLYWKKNRFVFMLFFVLILRCFFDMAYFFQPFDFVFYTFILGYKDFLVKQDNVRIKII